jgi:hypothetical protein
MNGLNGRRMVVATAVATAVAGGAVIARASGAPVHATAAAGGLAIRPALIETTAAAGQLGPVTVGNHSKATIDVTVTARPWLQSSGGAVSVDRRHTLGGVTLGVQRFSLAPNATRDVTVTVHGVPASGAEYGALEVIGLPAGASKQKGVVAGYRLISSLRLDPAKPLLSLKPGSAKLAGTSAARRLVLPVRNAGNTIQPVSGTVSLKGPLGTTQRTVAALRILPGKTVDVQLSTRKSLTAGAYTAKVKLTQGTQTTSIARTIRVKR